MIATLDLIERSEVVQSRCSNRTRRTDTRLADGRELIYYDRLPAANRSARDGRFDLAGERRASEVREDPIFGEPVVIASHRQTRTHLPSVEACPLCPTRPGAATEIPDVDYEVVVFENRFPALAGTSSSAPEGDRLFSAWPGAGRCEVICFSSDHRATLAGLPAARLRTVIDAWADRTAVLLAGEAVKYVLCFENRGEEIGVTQPHPHGQIYGYPFVPTRFARAATRTQRYVEQTGECLQCSLLAKELCFGERVVAETSGWIAYVPHAARWPYQLRVVPRTHVPDLMALDGDLRDDLAVVYSDALRRLGALFDAPVPYVASWQQAPTRRDRHSWHLAAEIFTIRRAPDKLKYLAGSESAAGVWINDIAPERAAKDLRTALDNR